MRVLSLVAAATGPTLVHCSFGKDRTGVLVAVLLLAAGVRRDAVVQDYALSDGRGAQVMVRLKARGYTHRRPPSPELLRAPPVALEAALTVVEGWSGGVEGYLLEHGASLADLASVGRRLAANSTVTTIPATSH